MSKITYLFVKCGSSIYFFLNFADLICRGSDISKYLREYLELQTNESMVSGMVTREVRHENMPI